MVEILKGGGGGGEGRRHEVALSSPPSWNLAPSTFL